MEGGSNKLFLADRTNGRAIGTVLRLSVVCLHGMYCFLNFHKNIKNVFYIYG